LCPLDYLYSLYGALVSIHVPNDKTRAVVDVSSTMTVRLGSMLVVGFGVMIAVLKFLQS
jgi:hypothetical protein